MFIDKIIKKHKLIYIPIDASAPDKRTIFFFAVWFAIAFFISCYLISYMSHGSRGRWLMYLLGMLPMVYAFQDKTYVEENVRSDFGSLMIALYKGNIFYILIMIFSAICHYESIWTITSGSGCFASFWLLSIPLIVFYKIKHWIVYGTFCFVMSYLFIFYIRSTDFQDIRLFYAVGVMLIVSLCISLFVSYRQIIKNFDTNKSKESLHE